MNFTVNDNSSFVTHVTDAYPFTPGTTPPRATPAAPYQGSYEGPAFVLGDTLVSSVVTAIGQQRLDSDIWGFRLGPYLETPLCTNINLSVSGGLAVGLLNSTASWTQTVSVTGGSSASTVTSHDDFNALWGYYLRANASWQLSKRWSAVGGVQYQYLGIYEHNFGGQVIQLDLSKSVFITVGLSYSF